LSRQKTKRPIQILLPLFGFVVVSFTACGEGDTKGETSEQNHHQESNLSGIHGVPREGGEKGEEGQRYQFARSARDSHQANLEMLAPASAFQLASAKSWCTGEDSNLRSAMRGRFTVCCH
jgi:hypothetical protein